jgi:hypothetical protein
MSEFLPFGDRSVEEFADDADLRASGTFIEVLSDDEIRLYNPKYNIRTAPFKTTKPVMDTEMETSQ